MADEIASLILKVESVGVGKATDALDNLTKSGLRAEDTAGAMSDAWGGLGKSAQTATGHQDRYVQSVNRYLQQEKEAQKQTRLTSEEWNKQTDALQELIGQINPLTGAFGRLDEAEKKLRGFHKSGVLDAEGFKEYSAQINKMRVELEAAAHARTEEGRAEREAATAEKAATIAKQSFIDKLKTESETLGLTSHQLMEYKAAQLGVTKEAQPYIAKLKAAENATGSLGLKAAGARRELGYLAAELARGNFGQLRASGITLANRAGWIDKLFTLRGLGIAGVIGGISAALYAMGKSSWDAYEANKALADGLLLTGGYAAKNTTELQNMSDEIAALTGTSITSTRELITGFASSGKYTKEQIKSITRTVQEFSRYTKISSEQAQGYFSKIYSDPVRGLAELDKQFHFLKLSQLEYIDNLEKTKGKQEAVTAGTELFSDVMHKRLGNIAKEATPLEEMWEDIKTWSSDAWNYVGQGFIAGGNLITDVIKGTIDEIEALLKTGDLYIYGFLDTIYEKTKNVPGLNHLLSGLSDSKAIIATRKKEIADLWADYDKRNARIKLGENGYRPENQGTTATGAVNEQDLIDKWLKKHNKNKSGAYHDDEATRLLMQYREKGAKLQGEINNANLYSNQKLTESEKELLALETLIAGMKGKTLTAADKSILAHQKELEAVLNINVEKEKQLRHDEALNRLQAKSVQLAQQHRQQLEQLRAKGEFDVASLGMGNKQRQRAQEEFNLRQQFANVQKELERSAEKDGTLNSPEYFAQAAENAAALNEQLAQLKDNYANMDKAQGDWHAGAERAFQNVTENAMNAAGATEQAFNLTFSSMTNGLETFVTTGKMNFRSFVAELLAGLAKIMAQMAVMQAASGIGKWLGFGASAIGGAAGGSTPSGAYALAAAGLHFAKGGAISSPDLSLYSGQILTQPTFFKFARGGVAGEAGPEAILPLARDGRGYMGVRLADKSGKQQIPPIQITVTQHIDQRGTDQNDQAAAQRNNQQLAKLVGDMVDVKVNRALDTAMRPGGKLAGVR
ncbi:TPA: phage tail tape measure protein [Salmonella enterica]|uniref:Phage tail tape measure protein n=1 Tax=Salmonella enterica TaxID=28901 RepID=A0A754EDY3_SALER|nr:phage tail tape measure protein [Salmonella enterica]ECU9162093.1 phage tail tape measure protein [Salmonella enterica subsp. enterica serovar Newport str. CFSAN000599]EDU1194336.1 phage tail tape measure protein [Salmonella enterica subsp. enterica serovar Heidelberg str. CFSAN000576]HAF8579481.1 phage tail tape measure protein [Salmonella enterica]